MKSVDIINTKTKEVYTSKEGLKLKNNFLEVGDIFIPKHNSIMEKIKKDVLLKTGKTQNITEYLIVAYVKNVDGAEQVVNDSKEIFLSLTPTQAKSLQKKLNEDILINQKVFEVRNYESAVYGTQIGVFLKGKAVDSITWDDVDEE